MTSKIKMANDGRVNEIIYVRAVSCEAKESQSTYENQILLVVFVKRATEKK